MMPHHPNLITDAIIVFKICSLSITMEINQKLDSYINVLNHIFNSD